VQVHTPGHVYLQYYGYLHKVPITNLKKISKVVYVKVKL